MPPALGKGTRQRVEERGESACVVIKLRLVLKETNRIKKSGIIIDFECSSRKRIEARVVLGFAKRDATRHICVGL